MILVAAHGLGKTMLAKHLVHQAILAGHSARFLTASDLVLDLIRQETARAPAAPPCPSSRFTVVLNWPQELLRK